MRFFLTLLLLTLFPVAKSNAATPNFVVIFCDDLGYGDLACFGNPSIKTPHLDQMASEGQKWTQFYVASPVCTPSRAGLLTGRYPIRNGMTSAQRVVLFPDSARGLPTSEITIAEVLKQKNYATAAVGKWHLVIYPSFYRSTRDSIPTGAFPIPMIWIEPGTRIPIGKWRKIRAGIPIQITTTVP